MTAPLPASIPSWHSMRMLGTRVDAVTRDGIISSVESAIQQRRRLLVGHQNLHSMALLQDDPRLRLFYDKCGLVYVDGMPVIGMAKLLGAQFERRHRHTSLDFIGPLLRRAAAGGWRVFYLGSAPAVIARAADKFRGMAPGLHLEFRDGYFDADQQVEVASVCAQVNAADPDLLIVGMGMPRQESWVLENEQHLNARVIFTIGALADYVAGAIPTPPRWAGKVGLEWAFRLLSEPRRLARRYITEPWRIARPFMKDLRAARGPERTTP